MKSPIQIPDDIDFWENVRVGSFDECWPYVSEDAKGEPEERNSHPQVPHWENGDRKLYRASRVAYKYAENLYGECGLKYVAVKSRCGNPTCVNPHHLKASEETVAHLDADEIEDIKSRPDDESNWEIAQEYGIEAAHYVGFIRNGNQ